MLDRRTDIPLPIACVTFASPRLLAGFRDQLRLDVPLYGDVDRALYDALGFGRGSVARVWLDPRVWRRYGQLLARGRRPPGNPLEQDTLQLGGDAVIAPGGALSWVYRSAGPDDRPSADEVVRASRAAWSSG